MGVTTVAVITTLANVVNCTAIDFQPGTHTRRKLAANDVSGAPTLTDMVASYAIATGGVLTLLIATPPNGSSGRHTSPPRISSSGSKMMFRWHQCRHRKHGTRAVPKGMPTIPAPLTPLISKIRDLASDHLGKMMPWIAPTCQFEPSARS